MNRASLVATVVGLAVSALVPELPAQERVTVLSESGTPVVATEILLTVGPADEENARAGLAHLAARSIVAQLRPHLDSIGARVGLDASKDGTSVSVIAAPDVWEEATRQVLAGLFREPPDSGTVRRERAAIVGELRGRQANPADAATRELDRAFFGADHPWGRPTVGTPETVERLTFAQVSAFLRENFTPDRAFVAVVGPVDPDAARAHLRRLLGSALPAPIEVIPGRRAERPVRRDYNSVTTWIAASYSFPETADEEALRFVAFLAGRALSYSPSQRSVYNAVTEVTARAGGGEMRIQVVVPPDEADTWANRLQDAIADIATTPMLEDVFEANLRRFRGERIMRLSAPEDRAREAARRLMLEGRPSPIVPEVDELTQERVRAAARALLAPALVILGPILN